MKKLFFALVLLMSMSAWAQSGPGWRVVGKIGNNLIVVVDEALKFDQGTYNSIESACNHSKNIYCNVSVWSDVKRAPTKGPVSDWQADAQIAYWVRTDGNWLWNCRINTSKRSSSKCFAGTEPKR